MTAAARRQRRKVEGRVADDSSKGDSGTCVKGTFSDDTKAVRAAYFDHKKKMPRPRKLTPLQKRMESGGA